MSSFSGINFPKVITVLAIIFGVSLGLCGLTAIASRANQLAPVLIPLGFLELAGILFSAVGAGGDDGAVGRCDRVQSHRAQWRRASAPV
jgi:hypothetical protein